MQKTSEFETEEQIVADIKNSCQEIKKLANKNCKLEKVLNFVEGVCVGEALGVGLLAFEKLTGISENLPKGTELLVGTSVGVMLGYALFRKNKEKHEKRRDEYLSFADEQLEMLK